MLSKTGERVIPGNYATTEEYIMYLRHVFAYDLATQYIEKSDIVLEVGSGEGYGTKVLASECEKIVGLDVDIEAIEHAQEEYGSKNCSFVHYDGLKFPIDDDSIDVVISFQVIEHVEDDALYVSEIYRVLKPGGTFIVATPNRVTRLAKGQKPWNRFHLHEYESTELENTLKQKFTTVKSYGVFGSDEVQQMELDRIANIQKMLKLDPLGLRKLMPESLKVALTKILRKKTQVNETNKIDAVDKYSIKDYMLSDKKIDDSLDLLAICQK